MLDQTTLIKIARLRTLSARQGKPFDVVRFVADSSFAQQVLAEVMDTTDEDVLLLGLDLMQSLGLVKVGTPPPPPPSAAAAPAPAAAELDKRYVGRLR
jgi:hypothetical protein